jgi:hypothetical protein
MPKLNAYLIKENYKQVEEIREIDYQVPTFAEFMKTYEGGMNYADLKGGDIMTPRSYGPGNDQSTEQTVKYVGKQAVSKTASSLLGPAALPIGVGLRQASEGADMASEVFLSLCSSCIKGVDKEVTNNPERLFEEIMKKAENKEKSEFAKWMNELGGDLIKSGIGNTLGEFVSHSSGGVGNAFNFLSEGYEQYENADETASHIKFVLHLAHLEKGVDYDSNCKVCNS